MTRAGARRALGWGLVCLGIVLGTIYGVSRGIFSQPDGRAEDGGQAAETAEPFIPVEVDQRFQRLVKNMWWHQDEMRDTLSLRDEQAEAMDDICLQFLRDRWARRRVDEERREEFSAFLETLDLGAAEEILQSRERLAAEGAVASERMTLAVLALLTSEQRAKARQELPELLRQPWLKSFSGHRARQAPGARIRAAGPAPWHSAGGGSGSEQSPKASSENPAGD